MDQQRHKSPNFGFLASHDNLLVYCAAQAERYVFDDPVTALIKLRQFGELLAKQAAAKTAIYVSPQDTNVEVLANLTDRGILTAEAARLFHGLRKAGNAAVHQHTGTQREALHQLRMARSLALWFQRFLGKDPRFKAGPFVPPPPRD